VVRPWFGDWMKASHRILLNTAATYGRSLLGTALGLFSTRWVLQALGQVDFGLYGVVGSVILLMTFLNEGLAVGVSRFYAYAIGRGEGLPPHQARDELTRWFNTAVSLHVTLPGVLIALGYPLGIHAIENWLIIPPDRMSACLWVFRFSLVTAFISMASVPFVAMYTAHQSIAEITAFSLLGTVGRFMIAYSMLSVQTDRLVAYALGMMALGAGIQLLLILRAVFKFDACRFNRSYLFERRYLKELFGFVGWKMYGMTCVVGRTQGTPVLVNRAFGPAVNAAYSISQQVSLHATNLSTALVGAFQPAMITMEGKGNRQRMLEMALQVCKFGALLVLLFAIPLMLEMETVLRLWLNDPPEHTAWLCLCMLAVLVIDKTTAGHMLAISAQGQIARYELVQGTILVAAIPVMWGLFHLGYGPAAVGYAFVATMLVYSWGRLWFCKRQLNLSPMIWVRQAAIPIALVVVCSSLMGTLCLQAVPPGFLRLCLTTAACGTTTAVMGWFVLLNAAERAFAAGLISKVWHGLVVK
jgi:O-antigen/teichoic acid export membrane protein